MVDGGPEDGWLKEFYTVQVGYVHSSVVVWCM